MTVGALIANIVRPILFDTQTGFTFQDSELIAWTNWVEAKSVLMLPYEATRQLQLEVTRDITPASAGKVVGTVDLTGLAAQSRIVHIMTVEFKKALAAQYYIGSRSRLEEFFSDQHPGSYTKGEITAPKWALWGSTILVAPNLSTGLIVGGCNIRYLGPVTIKATGTELQVDEVYQADLAHMIAAIAFTRIGATDEAQLHYAMYRDWIKSIGGRWTDDAFMLNPPRVPNVGR